MRMQERGLDLLFQLWHGARKGDIMKKLLIASDIHGSARWCEALMNLFVREGAGRILLLGDILYHGPRNDLPEQYAPKSVISMLNDVRNCILCVRGNCDGEVDQMVLEFPIMAEYALLMLGRDMVYATHGHHYNEENPLSFAGGGVLLYGHTHVPVCSRHERFTAMNPGSVSLPKQNSPHSCMMWEEGTFRWINLEDGSIYRECTL